MRSAATRLILLLAVAFGLHSWVATSASSTVAGPRPASLSAYAYDASRLLPSDQDVIEQLSRVSASAVAAARASAEVTGTGPCPTWLPFLQDLPQKVGSRTPRSLLEAGRRTCQGRVKCSRERRAGRSKRRRRV